jgi:integrase
MASIHEKGSGAYIVRWRVDGKQRAKQFRALKDAEAWKRAVEMTAETRDVLSSPGIPGWDDSGIMFEAEDEAYSVAAYARAMIDADLDLRDTTRALYLRNLRLHVEGTPLGKADIRSVTPDMVRDWWRGLDVGIGARRNAQQLVAKVFNRAVVAGDIDTSPLKRAPEVRRPSKARQTEVEPLTVAQVEALAEASARPRRGQVGPVADMQRRRDRLEVLVMGYGGLRAGEVGGLRVQDMARTGTACQLRLRQQVVRETGKPPYTSQLKTQAARRTVTIPASLYDELEAFLEDYPPTPDGRVFHGPNGEMRAHNDVNHGVQAAGKRIGLDVNAHQLRHTAVSLLIDAGANPRAIQAFVGHSDIRMTLGTYGHLFDHGGEGLANIMEGLRQEHVAGRHQPTAGGSKG